jgi:uncharacterized protein YdgA (DUF945 family)
VFELLELKLSQQNYLANKLHIKLEHRDVNDLQTLLEQAASSNEKLCSIEEFLERQIRPYDYQQYRRENLKEKNVIKSFIEREKSTLVRRLVQ